MNEAPTNENIMNHSNEPTTVEPTARQNAEAPRQPAPDGTVPSANAADHSPHSSLRSPLSETPYPYAPNAVAAPISPVKKPPFPVSRKDYGFAAAFLALCVAVVAFGLFGGLNLGFTVSYGALFLALSAYLKRPGVTPGPFGWACGGLALASTASYFLYTDYQVKFFMSVSVCCLSAVWFYELSGRKEEKGDLGLVVNLWKNTADNTFSHFGEGYRGLLFSGSRKGLGKALIGALCAMPVAAVAVSLLVKADGAFEALTVTLLENSFFLLVKIGLGLFAGVFVIAFALGLRKTEPQPQKESAPGRLDAVYAAAFTAVLCVCYCFYLFSQLAYFFDAFRGMIPEGYAISFSDYARQGFFELCWIAGINFAVVFAVLLLSKPNNSGLHPALKVTCTFICLFTLVIIATAVAKMALYINEYGMTRLRVRTGLFMCFIVAVFVALTLRLYWRKARVLRVALLGAAATLLLLGAGNDDAFIARYNYANVYRDNPGYSAVEEMKDLGPAGVPYLTALAENVNPRIKWEAHSALLELRYDYYGYDWPDEEYAKDPVFDYSVKTQSGSDRYNVAVAKAYEALDAWFADSSHQKTEEPTTEGGTEPATEGATRP